MAQISLPHQLVNGTVADASQVMANFNAIVNVVNGNLGSDNLGNLTGSEITVPDLNSGTGILSNFTQRFQAGSESVMNVNRDDTAERTINFPRAFPGTPIVFVQVRSSHPRNWLATYADAEKTSFTLRVTNVAAASVSNARVDWLAIYTGAM